MKIRSVGDRDLREHIVALNKRTQAKIINKLEVRHPTFRILQLDDKFLDESRQVNVS